MQKSFKDRIFAIVDVETTGGSPVHDRIIEIAILRVENGVIADTFQSLVNPECSIPGMITAITGITAGDLNGAPVFAEIAPQVKRILDGAVFVAHNARFDYGFVRSEFTRLDDRYSAKCLCSVRLSRKLSPRFKRHDLSSVIERWGLDCDNRHRAYDDAHAVWQFMNQFMNTDPVAFDAAINELLGTNTLPQLMNSDALAELPDTPGVYIFYGPEDEILYVGKSKSIRTRVMSHFSNDSATTRGMAMYQQVTRIETRTTAGELGALLLESELIKSLQPLYNKIARRKRKLVIARHAELPGGYSGIILEYAEQIAPEESSEILGIFKSRAQARKTIAELAQEHSLCEKLCGSESGGGACFGSQIGRCKGACTGRESAFAYNARFAASFAERRIRIWPFSGPVMIEEKCDDGSGEAFVIDNWCLVKSIQYDETGAVSEREHVHDFDHDNYKILVRYILDRKHVGTIRSLQHQGFVTVFTDDSEHSIG